jgi:hypothetical protein
MSHRHLEEVFVLFILDKSDRVVGFQYHPSREMLGSREHWAVQFGYTTQLRRYEHVELIETRGGEAPPEPELVPEATERESGEYELGSVPAEPRSRWGTVGIVALALACMLGMPLLMHEALMPIDTRLAMGVVGVVTFGLGVWVRGLRGPS